MIDYTDKQTVNPEALLRRAAEIMGFHAARCPLNPMHNYSGSEEHLAEYRAVINDINDYLRPKADHADTEYTGDELRFIDMFTEAAKAMIDIDKTVGKNIPPMAGLLKTTLLMELADAAQPDLPDMRPRALFMSDLIDIMPGVKMGGGVGRGDELRDLLDIIKAGGRPEPSRFSFNPRHGGKTSEAAQALADSLIHSIREQFKTKCPSGRPTMDHPAGPVFRDGKCPRCGEMCGNNGSGPLICRRCGWIEGINPDPDYKPVQHCPPAPSPPVSWETDTQPPATAGRQPEEMNERGDEATAAAEEAADKQ